MKLTSVGEYFFSNSFERMSFAWRFECSNTFKVWWNSWWWPYYTFTRPTKSASDRIL